MKRLQKKTRLGLQAGIVILVIVMIIGIYTQFNQPAQEEVTYFQYTESAKVDFDVKNKDDSILSSGSFAGGVYLVDLIEQLNTVFSYDFTSQEDANVRGDYEIVAVVRCYDGNSSDRKVVWEEDFILKSKQDFAGSSTVSITEEVNFQPHEYIQFAESIERELRLRLPMAIYLHMNVNLTAETGGYLVQQTASPGLVFPIGSNQVEIQKLEMEESYNLTRVEEIELPASTGSIATRGVGALLLTAAGLYVSFFTVNAPPKSKLELHIKKILREHRPRLVALERDIDFKFGAVYRLKTIDDLIKVADELTKPILYVHQLDPGSTKEFFVVDGSSIYIYKPGDEDTQYSALAG